MGERSRTGFSEMSALLRKLASYEADEVLVLGIGNPMCGDDGVGSVVCEQIRYATCLKVTNGGNAPENHLGPIIRYAPELLLIIDATDFGGQPGQIRVFLPDQLNGGRASTHYGALSLLIKAIRSEINPEVYLIGIQPRHMHLSEPMSPAVLAATETLSSLLVDLFAREPVGC